jgi:hypothetical protein
MLALNLLTLQASRIVVVDRSALRFRCMELKARRHTPLLSLSDPKPTPYMLADKGIRRALESGELVVDPFSEQSLQPASYDFRIGRTAFVSSTKEKVDVSQKGQPRTVSHFQQSATGSGCDNVLARPPSRTRRSPCLAPLRRRVPLRKSVAVHVDPRHPRIRRRQHESGVCAVRQHDPPTSRPRQPDNCPPDLRSDAP